MEKIKNTKSKKTKGAKTNMEQGKVFPNITQERQLEAAEYLHKVATAEPFFFSFFKTIYEVEEW